MTFGRLVCAPLSVREVIDSPDLDNKHVAVHGIFYLGEGCGTDEFLLLPKEGPFDGVGPIPMPVSLNRGECLLIEQPGLGDKLGSSGVCGSYIWKHDCILVGQIRHRPGMDHPFRIGDLWVMMLQDWLGSEWGVGRAKGLPYHQLRLVSFSPPNPPELPWSGPALKQHGDAAIRLDP
jgi:hypothetical protein